MRNPFLTPKIFFSFLIFHILHISYTISFLFLGLFSSSRCTSSLSLCSSFLRSYSWSHPMDPFAQCPFKSKACQNGTCTKGHEDTLCAICTAGYTYSSSLQMCTECTSTYVALSLGIIIGIVLLAVIFIVVNRRKIRKARNKYSKVYRDVMMVLAINITFAQIGGALPSVMPSVGWPTLYMSWLQNLSFVNLDILSMLGFSCAVKVGFELRFCATAGMVVMIVTAVFISYARQKSKLKRSHAEGKWNLKKKSKETRTDGFLPAEIQDAAEHLFDMMDREGDGVLEVAEFEELLQYMDTSKTKKEKEKEKEKGKRTAKEKERRQSTQHVMKQLFHSNKTVRRSAFVKEAMNGSLGKGGDWIQKQQNDRLRTSYISVLVQVCLLFHAPLSQKVFYYFNVVNLNGRSFLRDDMSLEMGSPRWSTFLPVVLFFLVAFTIGLPLYIFISLITQRKELHSPRVMARFGFLYARL